MNWNDIIDNNKNDALNQNYSMQHNQLLEFKQALLSKKKDKCETAYSVNREYINSPEFHAKFEKISTNKNVQEALYKQSGRLLEFVDSLETDKQSQEHLLAIDAQTGELIVDNFDRDGDTYGTGFDDNEYEKIKNCSNQIVLLHNHSLNGPPSKQDIMSCLKNDKIAMSVIVCHNGDIYTISDVKPEFETAYNKTFEKYKINHNENDASRLAMTQIYKENDKITSTRHKLFVMKKLLKGEKT